ncbi:hypothetical protein F5884DRAFT_853641 [Xylogone sp. PMI_703]|nr:hypothetical protein F5884DRAFT_853641 [Xylogone sp. PMI_703]
MTDYYDNYFFTSNVTSYVCPNFGDDQCKPPNACARDPNTGKRYCCDAADNICWALTSTCANDGSTIDCGDGQNTWCCLDQTEICTQIRGQINICWNSAHDTLNNISISALNKTYSSLSSATPSASSWTFDPVLLIAATQTYSTKTSTSTSVSTTSSAPTKSSSAPPPPTTTPHSSSSLSGGAIAGIVIGVIAALVLLAIGIFLLRRRNKQRGVATTQEGPTTETYTYGKIEPHSHELADPRKDAPGELYSHYHGSEMDANQESWPPQELPASEPNSSERHS